LRDRPFRYQVPLLVTAGGTTNMTAKDTGVNDSLDKILSRLATSSCSLNHMTVERKVLEITIPDRRKEYGFFVASAGICQAMDYYHTNFHKKGMWGAPGIMWTFVRYLVSLLSGREDMAVPVRISIDDAPWEEAFFTFLTITTLERLILGIRPFRCKNGMNVAAVEGRAKRIFRELPAILAGRPSSYATRENGYWLSGARTVRLLMDGPVSVDGEVRYVNSDNGPVTISSGGTCQFLKL
jgi:hypothetical protein